MVGRRRSSGATSQEGSEVFSRSPSSSPSSTPEHSALDTSSDDQPLRFRHKRSPLNELDRAELSKLIGLEDVSRSGSGSTSPRGAALLKDSFLDEEDIPPMKGTSQIVTLDEELRDFVKENKLANYEIAARNKMVETISDVVCELWPGSEYSIFGSYATGLAYSEADIDISFVLGNNNSKTASQSSVAILKLEKRLLKEPEVYGAVKSIPGARVPIVKGIFLPCGIHFDISTATETDSLEAGVKYIRRLSTMYPLLHPLSMIIKQILKLRNLDQPFTGGMGGYCVVILVAAFLKSRKPRSPYVHRSIMRLRSGPVTSLAVALLEFLELFGSTFNYRDVSIDIRNRLVFVPKRMLKCETSPGLSVIDPMSPTDNMRDIGGAYFKWEFIRKAFAWVGTVLTMPYKKIMSIRSCNVVPGNTMLERVMNTDTIASKIKELCMSFNERASVINDKCSDLGKQAGKSNQEKSETRTIRRSSSKDGSRVRGSSSQSTSSNSKQQSASELDEINSTSQGNTEDTSDDVIEID